MAYKRTYKLAYRLILPFLMISAGIFPFEGKAETRRAYLITAPTSVNRSELHIINTERRSLRFSGTLFDGAGSRLGRANTRLHDGAVSSQGRLILSSADLADIFDIEPWQGPAMLEVTANDDFKLMIKLRSPSGFVSNTNCVAREAVHNIEGHDQPDQTLIRFINIGRYTINNIRGNLYRTDGNRIGGRNRTLIPSLRPKQQVWIDNSDLANIFGDTWSGPATLNVSERRNLRLLNLNRVNSETLVNFSCFEGVEEIGEYDDDDDYDDYDDRDGYYDCRDDDYDDRDDDDCDDDDYYDRDGYDDCRDDDYDDRDDDDCDDDDYYDRDGYGDCRDDDYDDRDDDDCDDDDYYDRDGYGDCRDDDYGDRDDDDDCDDRDDD